MLNKKNKFNNIKKNKIEENTIDNEKKEIKNLYSKIKNWLFKSEFKNKILKKNEIEDELSNYYKEIITGIKKDKTYQNEKVFASDSNYSPFLNENKYITETNALLVDNNFMGYQEMSVLSQNGILRKIAEDLTDDMLRKGFKIKDNCNYDNTDSETDKLKTIENIQLIYKKFDDLKLNLVLKKSLINTFIFGGNLLYFGFKDSKEFIYNEEKRKSVFEDTNELILDNKKIKKGSLTHLKSIEPTYITPYVFNFNDPTGSDFMQPLYYRIMGGHEIHKSRFCKMVQYEAPDVLKAKYMYFGIPLLQLLIPYARDFEKIRLNIPQIIERFNLNILKVDMNNLATQGDEYFEDRIRLFTESSNNFGCLVVDKDQEDFEQIQIPLANLSELLDQAATFLSMISCIPQSKLFGQSIKGMNSSGDYEMRSYYENISKLQQDLLEEALHKILEVVQLDLFGEINQDLKIEFNSLFELDQLQKANIESIKVNNLTALVNSHLLSQKEALTQAIKSGEIELLNNMVIPDFNEDEYLNEDPENLTNEIEN